MKEGDAMPEIPRRQSRDWASRVQIHGVLNKKPFAQNSNSNSTKWAKRFFLVKDGFLMYYDAHERKDYERREFFNIHPKGVIPLGECRFKTCREPQQPFCLQLDSQEIDGRLVLATESEFERDRWLETMERSRRVTWKNSQLGDEMIRKLEDQGLQMAIEKQDYIDRLQSEVLALSEEKMRTEELERVNQELEKEKEKLELFTKEIQEEYEKIKVELNETTQLMQEVQDDRITLSQSLDQQSQQLKELDCDKQKILKELQSSMAEQTNLTKEKQVLAEKLQNQLSDIEARTAAVQEEKSEAELRLRDNQERLDQLEYEKSAISEHAHELESTIHDLVSQKEMTEKELKEEIRARISAEERLNEAERSLKCLDHAVQTRCQHVESDAKEEMTINVKKLKDFFENLAQEAKISSEKPLIIRNGLMARKTMARRAKTVRYENRKRSSNNTMSCDLSALRPKTQLRRAATSMHQDSRERFMTAVTALEEEQF